MAQIKERRPDILVEGPIQYDAAVDPNIAAIKIKVGHEKEDGAHCLCPYTQMQFVSARQMQMQPSTGEQGTVR